MMAKETMERIKLRSDFYTGLTDDRTVTASKHIALLCDDLYGQNTVNGYASWTNKSGRRFLHVLVNTVKDFKDQYHRYKCTGVAEAFDQYRQAEAYIRDWSPYNAAFTPSNTELWAWFHEFHGQERKRLKLKAMQYSFKVR